tara:strand:+ start:19578 stop:19835 length:258 start_codon:yes stop_codon:yes gene_type:complete
MTMLIDIERDDEKKVEVDSLPFGQVFKIGEACYVKVSTVNPHFNENLAIILHSPTNPSRVFSPQYLDKKQKVIPHESTLHVGKVK